MQFHYLQEMFQNEFYGYVDDFGVNYDTIAAQTLDMLLDIHGKNVIV